MFSRFKLAAPYLFSTNIKSCSSLARNINFPNSASDKCDQHFEPVKLNDDQKQFTAENQTNAVQNVNPYYIENGLRKVYPYYYLHSTSCKGRWVNQTLIDLYMKEFALYPVQEVERRILSGILQVNGQTVGLDYKLKNSDLLTANIHRHELAVLAAPIKVVYEDEDLLVINKPPSIPVHPCGLYQSNTMLEILSHEGKWGKLSVCHRLDRLTSGVLIFSKSTEKSRELHEDIKLRNVKKEYVCRVEGEFPDGVIICNKPLKQFYHKMGVSLVDPHGKMSITEFEKLSFNGQSSVVLCRPHTGRTHQIRVHLQYLGHPIINDPLYNSYAFGPDKGKHGIMHKSNDQLLKDLLYEHSSEWWLEKYGSTQDLKNENESTVMSSIHSIDYGNIDEVLLNTVYKKDPTRFIYDKDCYFCTKFFRDPKPTNLVIFLHAFRYQNEKWEFSTEIPEWAQSDWDIM